MRTITYIFFVVCIAMVGVIDAQRTSVNNYVKVNVDEDNATSELLRMPTGAVDDASGADIGIMYFGPGSDSDLSVILYMNGSRARYSSETSYGIKFFTDDIALRSNVFRGIYRVVNEKGFDRLHFHLKREELAWLATGRTLRIEVYDLRNEKVQDRISFAELRVAEFKRFAKSVLLIISTIE